MNKNWVVRRKNEHQYVTDRLSAYLDRQVSQRDVERIKIHLETCEPCQQALETLLWTKQLLRQVPVVPVPRSFVVREADVAPVKTTPRRSLFAMQWATAVVALLFVVVLFGDALTGGWRQAMPEMMLAEPVAMEQKVGKAPKAVEVEQDVVIESESASRSKVTPESEIVIEKESEAQKGIAIQEQGVQKTDDGEAGGTLPDDETVRVFVPEAESGEAKVGTGNAVTSTAVTTTVMSVPAAAQVAEGAAPVEPAPSVEAELMAAPATPAADEPENVAAPADEPLPEPIIEQPSEPVWGSRRNETRVIWRGVEVGLGMALIGLIVAVVLLRRRA